MQYVFKDDFYELIFYLWIMNLISVFKCNFVFIIFILYLDRMVIRYINWCFMIYVEIYGISELHEIWLWKMWFNGEILKEMKF